MDKSVIIGEDDKYAMREAFTEAHIATPKFYKVDRLEMYLFGLNFPVIVKPTDRSGSCAVTKVTDFRDLEAAIKEAVRQSFEKQAIVEEYIEGDEYCYETISCGGNHTNLAITKKYMAETSHPEPCELSEDTLYKVHYVMKRALNALKITDGVSHGKFKITPEGEVRIIDINLK